MVNKGIQLNLLFEMQTGISGDMILGALFDLGLDFKDWDKNIRSLGFTEMDLQIKKVLKNGIAATKFDSTFPPETKARHLPEIEKIIKESHLSQNVKGQACQIFNRLAEVEAKIHGVEKSHVHFHEVGAADAIVDIVGACLGFEMLGVENLFTTAFPFGQGTVKTQHGILSEPVPATIALTMGFPSKRTDIQGELCTPTGAAIVTTLAKPISNLPKDGQSISGQSILNEAIGYGAGSRDLAGRANVLRICLFSSQTNLEIDRDLYQVECNLDSMTGEVMAYVCEKLFDLGAKDVWQESITMKKNREAIKLCALVSSKDLQKCLQAISLETNTGGVRYFPVQRLVAEKSFLQIDTPFGKVDMKGVQFQNMPHPRYTPEFESCRLLAKEQKRPLMEIYAAANLAMAKIVEQG